ncbi:MAG: hypothetical protein C0502_09515 [Opitutus sp.]|nr:hypothetical protein [Opitutus sp.]
MRPLVPVAPRVRHALNDLATRFAARDVRVFLFGSAAPSWPLVPAHADLDIGYEIGASDPAQRARLRRELLTALELLPTVRPVDAVDFDSVAPEFAAAARSGARLLPDEHA